MQNQVSAQPVPTTPMPGAPAQTGTPGAYQPYAAYQAPGGKYSNSNIYTNYQWLKETTGYYGAQAPASAPQNVPPQGQYGFPNYGYGGGAPSSGPEN